MSVDDDMCQLEISLGGYKISLRDLMRLQGEEKIVLKLPDLLEVDLRFLSVSFGSGLGVIDGDDLVITLRQGQPALTNSRQQSDVDRDDVFSELEKIYRKLSFRKPDKD